MTCDQLAADLVDSTSLLTASPAAADHLAGCASCRSLVEAHRAARELARLDVVPSLPTPDLYAELGRRRRSRVVWTTASVLGVALLSAFVASRLGSSGAAEPRDPAAALVRPEPSLPRTENVPLIAPHSPEEASLPEPPPELGLLLAEIRSFARRDVTADDFTYASFGELPRWLAMPRDRSLEAAPFDAVLAPIHALEEDVP